MTQRKARFHKRGVDAGAAPCNFGVINVRPYENDSKKPEEAKNSVPLLPEIPCAYCGRIFFSASRMKKMRQEQAWVCYKFKCIEGYLEKRKQSGC